jgi:hypothetical protein
MCVCVWGVWGCIVMPIPMFIAAKGGGEGEGEGED